MEPISDSNRCHCGVGKTHYGQLGIYLPCDEVQAYWIERGKCPRCGEKATTTFTRRGTARIHFHRGPDGNPCRSDAQSRGV